jgi:solute:Na+ symporter, SSS family
VLGLVVIGFLAAMISTLSSILNSAQTLVTMDMIAKVQAAMAGAETGRRGQRRRSGVDRRFRLWAPQIQHFDSVVKYFQQLLSYMAPPVVAVFLAGLVLEAGERDRRLHRACSAASWWRSCC